MKMSFRRDLVIAVQTSAAALALRLGAQFAPGFADSYAGQMNAFWVGTLGRLFSIFPFSVCEFGLYVLVIVLAVSLVSFMVSREARKHFQEFIGACLVLASVLFLLYEANIDIYFSRTPFATAYGYGTGSYTTDELADTAEMLASEVNRWAPLVSRDKEGGMVCGENIEERTAAAMEELGETYPMLAGWYPKAKPIRWSYLMSMTDLAGIYFAFTVEANYNRDMTDYNFPFTMSHELSHVKGVLRENEANFIAYLNCMNAKDADIRYSGALLGWIYCGNELYKRDTERWREIALTLCEEANYDLTENTAFWDRYRGKVADAAQNFNDSYLKAQGQADGKESYNRVVDLIVSYEKSK